ncbi:alkaline phosphatase [Candidatus Latescibacterota bacterium]
MMKSVTLFLLVFISVGLIFISPASAERPVKNIILFISDGCGYNQIAVTDYYQYGRQRRQVYEKFPVSLPMATFSTSGHGYDGEEFWSSFDYGKGYATDSSSAVTAMATGEKTNDGALNVAVDGITPLTIITEYARTRGFSTGTITSVQISHATPAGFGAHNMSRNNYVEIAAEMLLDSELSVIMGAGHPLFDDDGNDHVPGNEEDWRYVGGESVFNGIMAGESSIDGNEVEDCDGDGIPDVWSVIQDKSEFRALMKDGTPKRVFGLAKVGTTLQQKRSGGNALSMPYEDAFNENVPTLAEMTGAALNILDNNPDGFFLHVEGGAVDWAGHENMIGRLIEEETDFNNAVAAAVLWVRKNSDWKETLIIVTGDHETGYIHGPDSGPDSDPLFNPIVNNGRGELPGFDFYSTSHSNSLIPLFAKGGFSGLFKEYATGSDPVHGAYIDNTDVFRVCSAAMGINLDTQPFDDIAELIEFAADMGLKKSLLSKLTHARAQIRKGNNHAAVIQLENFIKLVAKENKKKKGKSSDQTYLLVEKTQSIIESISVFAKRVVTEDEASLIGTYTLHQNKPNPFNPTTTIEFTIPSGMSERVSLQVFDIRGAHIKTLTDRVYGPGSHSAVWNGTDKSGSRVSSGMYIYSLRSGNFFHSNTMTLIR